MTNPFTQPQGAGTGANPFTQPAGGGDLTPAQEAALERQRQAEAQRREEFARQQLDEREAEAEQRRSDITFGGSPEALGAFRQQMGARQEQAMTAQQAEALQRGAARGLGMGALGMSGQFRAQQLALLEELRGGGPSAAEMQMQRGLGSAARQALAIARSGRGNPALALRQAGGVQGSLAQQAALGGAQLRAQEEARRQALAAQMLQAGRAGDVGLAQGYLGMGGQDLAAQSLAVQRELGLLGQLTGAESAQQQAMMGFYGLQSREASEAAARRQAEQQRERDFMGNIIQTGATAAIPLLSLLSDRRAKRSVGRGEPSARAFLEAIRPRTYRYKQESDAAPKRLGVMAQDVERGAPHAVRETSSGKAIDVTQAMGPVLASLAALHSRTKRLERGRGHAR
jgi:hypothetical protein